MTELRSKHSFIHSFIHSGFLQALLLNTGHMMVSQGDGSLDLSVCHAPLPTRGLQGAIVPTLGLRTALVLGPMMALGLVQLPSTLGQFGEQSEPVVPAICFPPWVFPLQTFASLPGRPTPEAPWCGILAPTV